LRQAYLQAGVPSHQIVHVMDDEECTLANTRQQLLQFLMSIEQQQLLTKSSTLVFYYGGHGMPGGFVMSDDEWWPYADVVSLIESEFQGGRVLYLLDCCASGNLIDEGSLESSDSTTVVVAGVSTIVLAFSAFSISPSS